MFATFKIVTGNGEPDAAVPVDAVIRDGDLAFVWVEREPTLLERRQVKLDRAERPPADPRGPPARRTGRARGRHLRRQRVAAMSRLTG
jgi:hypothetical protein